MVKCYSFPMSLLHSVRPDNKSLLDTDNLTLGFIDTENGLQPKYPDSLSNSKEYFLWHIEIPEVGRATSRPKKYLRGYLLA